MGQEKVLYAVNKGGGMMTREDYINNLQSMIDDAENMGLYDEDVESLQVAIEALAKVNKIKEIIAIDNVVIQKDVLKYKMICEVLE